ncbi:unnamed protein product [Vitrella brassicaformis CCMP3155]|uniref:KIF-binding protein n=3 Tax=Vitrella brassicaformis TaxID=1169539 RepID=A0A0G4GMH4_VITBC|nr:unnamed protein product [Vitrella brassicaformis CCMP3155]|eukprot:CEM31394.1 unnamed protein product [Vitrella brassicaformis CCMP3155]
MAAHLPADWASRLQQYDDLSAKIDPETTPYASKYKGRQILFELMRDGVVMSEQSPSRKLTEALMDVYVRLAFNYVDTDEIASGEKVLRRAYQVVLQLCSDPSVGEASMQKHRLMLLKMGNLMASIWCNRASSRRGCNYLRRNLLLYTHAKQSAAQPTAEGFTHDLEKEYTLTLFYLAQAYGGMGEGRLSAEYCAMTLERQLANKSSFTDDEFMQPPGRERGGDEEDDKVKANRFDVKDWVRNACQLSDYFVNEVLMWTSEYLLHAAAVVAQRATQADVDTFPIAELRAEVHRDLATLYSIRLKFSQQLCQHPDRAAESFKGGSKAAGSGEGDGKDIEEDGRLVFPPEPPPSPLPLGPPLASSDDAATRSSSMDTDGSASSSYALPTTETLDSWMWRVRGENDIVWNQERPEVIALSREEDKDTAQSEERIIDTPPADQANGQASDKENGIHTPPDRCVALSADMMVAPAVHFPPIHKEIERRIRSSNEEFFRLRAEHMEKDDLPACVKEQPDVFQRHRGAAFSFEMAREIFKLGNYYAQQAMNYYVLDGYVTDHVRLAILQSALYRHLSYFEPDTQRIASMMSRRLKILGPLVEQLNPQHFLVHVRQMAFECGELCQELHDLKKYDMPAVSLHTSRPKEPPPAKDQDQQEDDTGLKPSGKLQAKLAELAQQAVTFYSHFINTFDKDPHKVASAKLGEVREANRREREGEWSLEEDDVKPYWMAKMTRASMLMKCGTTFEQRKESYVKALKEYESVLAYASKHPDMVEKCDVTLKEQVRLAKELAELLPERINRLHYLGK